MRSYALICVHMQHNCFTCVLPGQEKCFTRNAKDMVLPTLKFVYNRKGIATTTKEASVELRISFERKSKYISTGVRLLPKHWRGTYVTNRADAAELNETLDLIMAKVRKIVNTMAEEGRLDIGEIASRLANATAEKQSFLDFCEQRTQIRIYGKKGGILNNRLNGGRVSSLSMQFSDLLNLKGQK